MIFRRVKNSQEYFAWDRSSYAPNIDFWKKKLPKICQKCSKNGVGGNLCKGQWLLKWPCSDRDRSHGRALMVMIENDPSWTVIFFWWKNNDRPPEDQKKSWFGQWLWDLVTVWFLSHDFLINISSEGHSRTICGHNYLLMTIWWISMDLK